MFGFGKKKRPVADLMVEKLHQRLVGHFDPNTPGSGLIIRDPDFLHRGNPHHSDHDELGFRNSSVPESVSIICVGDSHVYGTTLKREQSWPHALGQLMDTSVYNAGIDGWGVMQYPLVIEELAPLKPDHVIVGISLGQDIIETFLHSKTSTHPLARRFWKSEYDELDTTPCLETQKSNSLIDSAERQGVSRNVILKEALKDGLSGINYAEIGDIAYYLNDAIRLKTLDLEDPVIQAGWDLSKEHLGYIKDLALHSGFTLSVVPIPTKEYLVYCRREQAKIHHEESLIRCGENEEKVLGLLREFCSERSIQILDPIDLLTSQIDHPIFQPDNNDPNYTEFGAQIIARYIHSELSDAKDTAEDQNDSPMQERNVRS